MVQYNGNTASDVATYTLQLVYWENYCHEQEAMTMMSYVYVQVKA